jgi:hypothetical protein
MRNIPTERVQFLTVPRTSYVYNANRDQLVKPEADKLFALLRADAPVAVAKDLPTDPPSGLPTDPPSGVPTSLPTDHPADSPAKRKNSYEGGGEGTYDSAFDYEEESHGNGKSRGKRPATPTPAPTFRGNTAAEDACR